MTEQTNTPATPDTESAPAPAARKPQTPIQAISSALESDTMAERLAASLDGTGISPARFKRAALAALARPEAAYLVEKCDRGRYTARS